MKYIVTVLFFVIQLIQTSLVYGQQDTIITRHYEIQYGSNPNIETGSQSAIAVSSLIFDQTNQLIKNNISSKTGNLFARIGNFGLVQFYFGSQLFAAIPHEYFGHYSRAKEFEFDPSLHLDFPSMGGNVQYPATHNIPAFKRQMISAAGPEVTAMIAYKATQQLYTDEYSPSYIGNFLISGKLIDQFIYLRKDLKPFLDNPNKYYNDNANYFSKDPVPNDPVSYALALTESYGYYDGFLDKNEPWVQRFDDMSVYTQNEFIKDQYKRMRSAYLQTALDPTNLYILYANALYLIKGQTFFKLYTENA